MTQELSLNELLVESQYLLKLQSSKITKIPRFVTAKCARQTSCSQSLDAFSRAHRVTNAFGGRTRWEASDLLAAIGGGVLLLRGRVGKRKERGGDCLLFI